MDPRVVDVRAARSTEGDGALLDIRAFAPRIVSGRRREHVRIDHDAGIVRLDVIEGTVLAGPSRLRFDLPNDPQLPGRLDAVRDAHDVLTGNVVGARAGAWLTEALLALHAHDARVADASLRAIADHLLGPGDWPGDGDHRKSRARRLVQIGESLIRAGPRAIFRRFAGRRLTALSSIADAARPRGSSPARRADRC